jgi:signal transduction histidine kinase
MNTMTETPSAQVLADKKGGITTLRAQLVWASLFPLVTFVLLAILVATVAFRQLTLTLALQRDTARVQVAAGNLAALAFPTPVSIVAGFSTALPAEFSNAGLRLFLIDQKGQVMAHSGPGRGQLDLNSQELGAFIQSRQPASQLTQSMPAGTQIIASYAVLPGQQMGLLMEEPLSMVMAPASYYQLILIGLLVLGMIFSLYMLSLSTGRVTGSIARLAENAAHAVPGSLFRPMAEQGPQELRLLIKAFNQMVVQLAEQQTSLRQYAHKALLSQEEERQRLSHELHDGTMQDLVGLVQRVELCRSEMDRNPLLARNRLDELQNLLEQTLADVRRISNALRPSILEDLGLPAALQALCNDLQKQMPSIQCQCLVTGEHRRLSADLELAVFRVVQEALGNIRKHVSSVTRVEVQMEFRESEVRAVVCNDGPVFPTPDVRSLVRNGHLGLAGMYERARLFHGELNISSDPAMGTTVRLRLPCPPESVGEAENAAA